MKGCLFCQIVAGEIPAQILFQDQDITVFQDIHPAAPAHFLAIPNQHIESISHAAENHQALLGKLLLVANQVAEQQGLTEEGFRYVINTGSNGGQTVFHLHLHILGGRRMGWPPG